MVFVYKNAADKNKVGELLRFNNEEGMKTLMHNIDSTLVGKCKAECKVKEMIFLKIKK